MAKVKEFPFASLGTTRLLGELRQELDDVADQEMAHLVDEKNKTIAALNEASKIAQAGMKDMKAQEVEALRDAGERLARALKSAARAAVKGDHDKAKCRKRDAEHAFGAALESFRALAEHAAGTHKQAFETLINKSKQQAKQLEDLSDTDAQDGTDSEPENPAKKD